MTFVKIFGKLNNQSLDIDKLNPYSHDQLTKEAMIVNPEDIFFENEVVRIITRNKYEPGGMQTIFQDKKTGSMFAKDCGFGFMPDLGFDAEAAINQVSSEARHQLDLLLECADQQPKPVRHQVHIFLEQGHLDHIIGLPFVGLTREVIAYSDPLTSDYLRKAVRRERIRQPIGRIKIFNKKDLITQREPRTGRLSIGPFEIDWHESVHSTKSYSLLIRIGSMKILHLSELRVEESSWTPGLQKQQLGWIGRNAPYDLVMMDGLLRHEPGFSRSEDVVRDPLAKLLNDNRLKGKLVLLPFISSKMGLLKAAMETAYSTNWAFQVYGGMMRYSHFLGTEYGWLPPKFIPSGEADIVAACTGSQGEERSFLDKELEMLESKGQGTLDWPKTVIAVFQAIIPRYRRRMKHFFEALAKHCQMILMPRREKQRLKLEGENIIAMEDFLGVEEDILISSGHERRGGQDQLIEIARTPIEKVLFYQCRLNRLTPVVIPEPEPQPMNLTDLVNEIIKKMDR